MGIKFHCPNGHKLNVKAFLAGKRGICPHCGIAVQIPTSAEREAEALGRSGSMGGSAAVAIASSKSSSTSLADTMAFPVGKSSSPAPSAPAPLSPTPAPIPAGIPVGSPAVTPINPAPMMAAPMGMAPLAAPLIAQRAMPMVWDPSAEAPNAVWYVRRASGGQFGPARGDIMRKWLGEGRVSAESLVWRDGWGDWRNAATVFPMLAPAAPAPAHVPAAPAAPAIPGLTAPATSPSRALRSRKKSNTFAVAMVVTLGIISVVLLALFIYVISQSAG
jgi:hypothetical protein